MKRFSKLNDEKKVNFKSINVYKRNATEQKREMEAKEQKKNNVDENNNNNSTRCINKLRNMIYLQSK